MPRPENDTTPNPLLEKRRGLYDGFQAWRVGRNERVGRRQGLFLACLIYGLLCRALKTAPPPTPSLKKGGGFMAVFRRGVRQMAAA